MKRDFIYFIIIAVVIVMYFRSCSENKNIRSNFNHNLEALNDSIEYFKNELGQEVAEKLSFVGSEKELRKILSETEQKNSQLQIALKNFKKVTTATEITTETKIDTVKITFRDTIPFVFDRYFKKENEFYTISGNVTNKLINFSSISIPNTQTIVLGKKKEGLFKTVYSVEVTNSNPFIKVQDIKAFNFTEKKKRFGVGVIGGYGVGAKFNASPFIGLGVSYDLIQF